MATTYLQQVKEAHPKATHHCVGIIFDEVERGNDDGEPGGTAKIPILQALKKYQLNQVLCVVVRYFGGKKLGVGGLGRAYFSSVEKAILAAGKLGEIWYLPQVTIECSYSQYATVLSLLEEEVIMDTDFQLQVRLTVGVVNPRIIEILRCTFRDVEILEREVVKYLHR